MKIWGAGLCGWVGPVSPLEVLPGCKVYKTLRACLGMFLKIVSGKQFSRTEVCLGTLNVLNLFSMFSNIS